jgi:hypothetical protein
MYDYIILLPYDQGVFVFLDFSNYITIQWFESSITYNIPLNKITFTSASSLSIDEYKLLIDQIFIYGRLNNLFTGTNVLNIENLILPITPLVYKMHITSTDNATSLTNGAALHVFGGALINKDLYIGGSSVFFNDIDIQNNIITNVTSPNNFLDVTNKFYVDNRFNNFTIGNVNGNFTQGQVIIAGTGGNITGFPNFTFDGELLSLNSTTNSIGLGSGGTLNIAGGASILGELYTNGINNNNQLISGVTLPLNPLDAVNKEYVDYYLGISNGDIFETPFVLSNNIPTPINVTGFLFKNTLVSSFQAIVYLQIPTLSIYDQWIINGVLKGVVWIITTKFIGDYPSKVTFSIINTGGYGQIQYTNTNSTGTATLRFKATTTSQGAYNNNTLGNIIQSVPVGGTGNTFFTNGCLLIGNGVNPIGTYINLNYTAGNLNIGSIKLNSNTQIITNVTAPSSNLDVANKWYVDQKVGTGGNLLLTGALTLNNTADATSASSGGAFTDLGGAGIAKKLYVGTQFFVQNVNMTPNQDDLWTEQSFNAANNVSTPTNITGFLFSNTRYFTAWVTINIIATSNLFAGFTLEGIQLDSNNWQVSSKFIGQNTSVTFNINSSGQIQYKSSNISGFVSSTIKFRAVTIRN